MDVINALLANEPTALALAAARDEIDTVLWRRDVRASAAEVAADSLNRGARDSAVIDGADIAVVDDSPMGRVLAAAQRVNAEVPSQVEIWKAAPLQVLAHLHTIAAIGFVDAEELGRPRAKLIADDPLHLGPLPERAAPELVALGQWLARTRELPGLLVAGIVHGELMQLRPFTWGSGLIARATVRCVLAERGLDPSLFTIPEFGMLEQGRGAYVRAIRSYATGTDAGLVEYFAWFAASIGIGARAVSAGKRESVIGPLP